MPKLLSFFFALFLLLITFHLSHSSALAFENLVNYQGRAFDSNNKFIADGCYPVAFNIGRFYTKVVAPTFQKTPVESAQPQGIYDTHPTASCPGGQVRVENGLFNALLDVTNVSSRELGFSLGNYGIQVNFNNQGWSHWQPFAASGMAASANRLNMPMHSLNSYPGNGWLYLGDQRGNVYGNRGLAAGALYSAGDVYAQNGETVLNVNGIYRRGRLHITSGENIFLLPQGGSTYVSRAWGGTGELIVDSHTKTGGHSFTAGNTYTGGVFYPGNQSSYYLRYDSKYGLGTNYGFKADGGLGAPLMWDSEDERFRIDPAGKSVINETYLNGESKLFFGAENGTGEYIYSQRSGSYPIVFATAWNDRLKIHNNGKIEATETIQAKNGYTVGSPNSNIKTISFKASSNLISGTVNGGLVGGNPTTGQSGRFTVKYGTSFNSINSINLTAIVPKSANNNGGWSAETQVVSYGIDQFVMLLTNAGGCDVGDNCDVFVTVTGD